MRRFFGVLCVGCLIMGTVGLEASKNIPVQSRIARLGAWATTGALFTGGLMAAEHVGENSIAYLTSLVPYIDQLATTKFPRLLSGAVVLPLTTYLYVKYHQLVWYFSYIIYSGKQISPIIARETAQHLDSYVRCMEMIRETHTQLDELIKKAETCVAGSGKEQAVRLIGDSIAAIFERELADAQAYLDKTRVQLTQMGLDQVCKDYSARGGAVTYALDLTRLRDFEHPDFSKIDIETLDHLIRDILGYWHTYLTSLAAAIDKRVVLCQKIHMLENFISGVLNRPLFPAFEQQVAPTPTVKEIFSDLV